MKERKLFILDVGHGNCTVLKDDKGYVVIDAGKGNALLEFLLMEGIDKVDVVLLSHADEDHIGGLIALLNAGRFQFGIVRMNSDGTKTSKVFDDLAESLDDYSTNKGVDYDTTLNTGHSGRYNQGKINIEILAPNRYIATKGAGSRDRKNRKLTSNSNSAVIRLVADDHPIALIPGDIDYVGFENLREDKYKCNADIVIFPHHGGLPRGNLEKFVNSFLEETTPQIVIFSIGREKLSNPNPRLIKVIREKVPDARIICTQLSKHCAAELQVKTNDHLTGRFAMGRKQNRCCGGTIEIDLNNVEESLQPYLVSHRKFIEIAAPTPLCGRAVGSAG